ncbi:MAG: DNA-directed RNA polymerase subunit omega [Acidimicrobiia bacterium]
MSDVNLDDLIEKGGGRFSAVVLSARRARQINAYFNQLGEGIGAYVPPQVHSLSRQPVTIAFEEITDELVRPGSASEDE